MVKSLLSIIGYPDLRPQLVQARKEVEHLHRLATAIARAESLDEMANVVAEECQLALGADAISIHILQDDDYFELASSLGCTPAYIEQWRRVPKTMVPIANVEHPEQALFVGSADQFKHELPAAKQLIDKSERHTIGYVPLVVNGRTSGILGYSYNQQPTHPCSREFILTLVSFCAQALERSRLFGQERQARHDAEMANSAKTKFLANISHEIRSPLGVIEGFSDLLSESKSMGLSHRRWARHIRRNSRQLVGLIGDVLDLSKIEAEKIDCENIPVELHELLGDIEASIRPLAADKGITLHFTYNNLPEWIHSDPIRLRQILLNLLNNAVKFTLAGRVTIKYHFTENEGLIAQVRDTGIGIPRQQQQNIFEPFAQGDASTSRKFGGSGLGLAISKRLAHALGGELTLVDSHPGMGSCFMFKLKCKGLSAADLPPRVTAGAGASHKLRGFRVLLVDDNSDNQELIRQLLTQEGAEVDVADNGYLGIRMAMAKDYSVVLMDIQMPDLDGYETVSRLRSQGYQRPIAALTAHALSFEKEKAARYGFNDYLTKPIDRPKLIDSLQRLVH